MDRDGTWLPVAVDCCRSDGRTAGRCWKREIQMGIGCFAPPFFFLIKVGLFLIGRVGMVTSSLPSQGEEGRKVRAVF